MNILITGGSGFIGSEISKFLLKRKYKVVILDLRKPDFKHINLKFVKGSITNRKLIKKIIKNKDIVYHLAGIADIAECSVAPVRTIEQNILPTINILNECSINNVKRFIFASTIYVHSEEGGFYKSSKKSCEIYIQEFSKNKNLKFTILRYGTIYGPSRNMKNNINKIVKTAISKKKVIYEGKINTKRRIIHAKDAARAAVEVLKKEYSNKAVLIIGNKNYYIKEIMLKIKNKLNIKSKILFYNKKIYGHYVSNPFFKKAIPSVQLKIKNQIDIDRGIEEVISFIKKKTL